MRLLQTCLLMITSTTCVAQPPMSDASNEVIDCVEITTSPQINDCVHQEMTASNALLSNEFVNFGQRTERIYASHPELGKELIERVQKAQDAWIAFRDLNCNVDAFEVEEGAPAYITTVNNCIIRMNAERIEDLTKLPH